MDVLGDGEDVVIVLLGLGPLGAMAAVFDLKLVDFEAACEFVEFRRGGIGDVKPREMREGLDPCRAILGGRRGNWNVNVAYRRCSVFLVAPRTAAPLYSVDQSNPSGQFPRRYE